MLYFYNKGIQNIGLGMDFEMGENKTYFATSMYYCKEKDIKNLFPNVYYFTKENRPVDILNLFSELGSCKYFDNPKSECHADFIMSTGQFRGFIKHWIEKSFSTRKIYNWDEHSFFVEYVDTMKDIAIIDNECKCEGKWVGSGDLMNWDKLNIILGINYSDFEESPIVITETVDPEYSLKVEDALYAFKNGITSIYTDEINEEINHNIRKMMLTQKVFSNFGADVAKFDIPLDLDITIKDIDYTNDKAILYFYYYSILPGIKTNLKHLRRVLDRMKV